MSIPNTGYQTELFSPESKKIMVNIDELEMQKSTIDIDLQINCDLQQWLSDYPFNDEPVLDKIVKWHKSLVELKTQYGISKEICLNNDEGIDSYKIIEELSLLIAPDATLVTDMGTSFTCTMQAFMNKKNTRLFTSSGTSSMGFGLPGAIGAYFGNKERPIYLIAGDGGFQMNIQELQTVKFHNIPIRMIILNSNGYLAISIMQQNSFNGNYVGSNPESGIDAPDFFKIAEAYGITSSKVSSLENFKQQLEDLDSTDTPFLIEASIPSKQIMRPRSQSLRREDGSFYSNGIEVMWPDLTASEVEDIESRIM
jgi:acetolactate synthase-1/2/3 large subunit